MRIAILAVGDELTCGYRLDTNSQAISRRLTLLPADVVLHLTVGDDLTVTDAASVGKFLNLSAATAISCTDGSVITMTAMYQPLQSAGTVTPTLSTAAAGVTTGTLLYLVNTSNTTINLADSGTAKLAGALALGQYDSAWLAFDGTNWIELSRSNN